MGFAIRSEWAMVSYSEHRKLNISIVEGDEEIGNYSVIPGLDSNVFCPGFLFSYRPGKGVPKMLIQEAHRMFEEYAGRERATIVHKVRLSDEARPKLEKYYLDLGYVLAAQGELHKEFSGKI